MLVGPITVTFGYVAYKIVENEFTIFPTLFTISYIPTQKFLTIIPCFGGLHRGAFDLFNHFMFIGFIENSLIIRFQISKFKLFHIEITKFSNINVKFLPKTPLFLTK